MGRFYQDLDAAHFDYELQPCDVLDSQELRGPLPDLDKPYFVCLGAAQTFGRFCQQPFPTILSGKLGLPVLNLGLAGSGPRAFLDEKFLGLINRAEFVVVQVLSGRSESNSAFDNSQTGATHGVRLRDAKPMRFEEFIAEELSAAPRARVAELIAETRRNWISRSEQLLSRITAPKILFWISRVSPDRTDDYSIWWKLLGDYPQLVNREMVERLRPLCDAYVETVGSKGLPQLLWPSAMPIDGAELKDGKLFNTYYPSPQMHEAAAADLLPVCRSVLASRMLAGPLTPSRQPVQRSSRSKDGDAPDFKSITGTIWHLLTTARRSEALHLAEQTARDFPHLAQSHRLLSNTLTEFENFRHPSPFHHDFLGDGSIARALVCSRRAIALDGSNFEDFLQAGYCLTILGDTRTGADYIRRATDLLNLSENPGLFRDMTDDWVPLAPSFLIVGVAKAGTTSLHSFISKHDLVLPPVLKEVNYFGNIDRGYDWYMSHFPRRPQGERRFITGEARVGNFDAWNIPQLVREKLPGVKLIVVLRDPVERALSHYYHDKRVGTEQRSLEDAIDEELSYLDVPDDILRLSLSDHGKTPRYHVRLGLYAHYLENWFSVFPPSDILVVVSEEFFASPERILRKVFSHLGLPYRALGDSIKENVGIYDDRNRDQVRRRLAAFYERHNERLFELLGRRVAWQGIDNRANAEPPVRAASSARIAWNRGEWSKAANIWKKCIAEHPSHPDIQSWLEGRAEALEKDGKAEQARTAFADAVSRFPESSAALQGLARTSEQLRDFKRSDEYWDTCIRRFPHHPRLREWEKARARALIELQDWNKADAALAGLMDGSPRSLLEYAELARLAVRRGDIATACSLWDEGIALHPADPDVKWCMNEYAHLLLDQGLADRCETLLEAHSAVAPDEPHVGAIRARLALSRSQPAQAADLIAEIIRRHPDHPDRRWWMPFRGDILVSLNRLDEAELLFQQFGKEFPDEPAALSGRAKIAQKRSEWQRAMALWEECRTRYPAHKLWTWAASDYLELLFRLGELEKAETLVRQLIRDQPDVATGYSGLARVLKQRHEAGKAGLAWEDCLRRFPRHPDRHWWLAIHGQDLIEAEDWNRAEEIYSELRSLRPDNPFAIASLARIASQKGEFPRAAELLEDCIARFPGHPDRKWWLPFYGDVLLQMNSARRAVEVFSDCISSYPENPDGYGGLARAMHQDGDVPQAISTFRDCIIRFPHSPQRRWWLPLLGHWLLETRAAGEAKAVFKLAKMEFPDDPGGLSGLACVAKDRGDWRNAIALIDECLHQFPEHRDARWWLPFKDSCRAALEQKETSGPL